MAWLDNLVAHWKLNETSDTREDAHSTNDLSDNNAVGYGAGKLGNAADFVSSNLEYFSITDNSEISLGSDDDLTLACWVKFDSIPGHVFLIVKRGPLGTYEVEYELLYHDSYSKLGFVVGNGSTAAEVYATVTINTGTWYLAIGWHDKTNDKLCIQINNGTVYEQSWSGGTQNGSNVLTVGAWPYASFYLDGLMDSVSIWKRVLTADERTSLYNSGAGLDYPFSVPMSLPFFRNQLQHLIIR